MYKEKYLKYKTKYLDLKNQLGGVSNTIQNRGGLSNFNLFGPSKKQKEAAAEKAAAEKVAAEKVAAEKAVIKNAAAKKAAAEKAVADKVAAEINDIIKSSKTFANAYKSQNSNSHKLHFYFYVNNWYTVTKLINGKRKKLENKNNVISFNQYFIYDNMNIYMSNEKYSPVQYNKYFSTNKLNINTFFTNFIELLIYIDLLKKNMRLLNGDNIDKFLKYLLPIRSRIKFIFNIDLSEDDIKRNYKEYNSYKDKYIIETYTCGYEFFIDDNKFNVETTDIKTVLGLDATVKSMAIGNFAKTKADIETTFIEDTETDNAICDKNPNLYNCRNPKKNLNAEFNQIMGLIPVQ